MAIASERPESGVRIALERDKEADPPWIYAGAAYVPDAAFPARVAVTGDGDVDVALSEDAASGKTPSPELVEKVRLIVRTAYRQAKADGEPPAWKIVRWRGEK